MTKFSNIKTEKQKDCFTITAVRCTGTTAKIEFLIEDSHLSIIPSHTDSEELPENLKESDSWGLYRFIRSSQIRTMSYKWGLLII